MAIHSSHRSMIRESLPEFLEVAEYCISYRKDPAKWGSEGCYGYPANVLLLAIVDAIGSYVIGGRTRPHFDILNHQEFYNLGLSAAAIDRIYEAYRCLGTHNAVLGRDVILNIGNPSDPVYIEKDQLSFLNLVPFLTLSKQVVRRFLQRADQYVPDEVTKH